jgi:Zn-dependent protease with chaperone function
VFLKMSNFTVHADDFRVQGEKTVLYISLAAMGFILFSLMRLSFKAILVLLGIAIIWVKIKQGQLLGQSVKVTQDQLTDIYDIAQCAADRLSMSMPDVFITQNPVINAYAIGFFGRKSVVLHSATIEAMSPDELRSIIGHEFSHIKCQHTHWLVFTHLKNMIRIPFISEFIGFLFLYWSRKAEYTCDRGGLIASGDLYASVSALAKVAVGKELFNKMNIDAFFKQRDFLDADDIAKLSERLSTHPYIVNRIYALQQFAQSEYYRHLQNARI